MEPLPDAAGTISRCPRPRTLGRRAAAVAACLLLAGVAHAAPPWAGSDGGDDPERARRELREQLRAERERWRDTRASESRGGAAERPDGRVFDPDSRAVRHGSAPREPEDGGRLTIDERRELRRQLHEAARARRGEPPERGDGPVPGGGGPGRPPDGGFPGGWGGRGR